MNNKCPNCQIIIEEEERLYVVEKSLKGIYGSFDYNIIPKKKVITFKQVGFDENSYKPISVKLQICPYCGIMFINNIREVIKIGIKIKI